MFDLFTQKATTSSGVKAERDAEKYLVQHGLISIDRNYHCKYGEIDLIMQDANYLVFIEVRFRQSDKFGTASETVTSKKQHKLIITAQHYIQAHSFAQKMPCRFDVIGVSTQNINWVQAAFT